MPLLENRQELNRSDTLKLRKSKTKNLGNHRRVNSLRLNKSFMQSNNDLEEDEPSLSEREA